MAHYVILDLIVPTEIAALTLLNDVQTKSVNVINFVTPLGKTQATLGSPWHVYGKMQFQTLVDAQAFYSLWVAPATRLAKNIQPLSSVVLNGLITKL